MIPARFEYVRAGSLEEALEALADPEARVLAGGQSLLPLMKLRVVRPALVVDIGSLELRGVAVDGDELRIGALTTWDELARAEAVQSSGLAAVAECAAAIGDLQVRNRGTIGGGLVHADPASDMPAVCLALDARLRLRSPAGERTVAAESFCLGPFTTTLARQEVVTEVLVAAPPPGAGSAYVAAEHPASGFAVAGAAALVDPDGSAKVAVTGVAGTPFVLSGDGDPGAALATVDVLGDRYAPAEYRRHLAAVVVGRAVERARARALESS